MAFQALIVIADNAVEDLENDGSHKQVDDR